MYINCHAASELSISDFISSFELSQEMYAWKIARVSWLFSLLVINIDSVVGFGEKSNSDYHTMIHSRGDPCNETEQ